MKEFEKHPHITICLTTYNTGEVLKHVLNAILKLDYPKEKLDLVVVDDYSDDGTWENLLKFKQEHSNSFHKIILFRSYSRNVAKARNKCLKVALDRCYYTDFVFIMDHDILLPENILKILLNHMMRDNTLGSTHGLRVSKLNNIFERVWRALWPQPYGYVEWADIECTLIRVKVLKDVGFFNESMTRWENREFIARVKKAGYSVLIDTRAECVHLSVSHQTKQTMGRHGTLEDFIKSILRYYLKILPSNVELVFKAEKMDYKIRILYYALLPYAILISALINIVELGFILVLIPIINHILRLKASLLVRFIGSIIIISQKILVAQGFIYYKIIKLLKNKVLRSL